MTGEKYGSVKSHSLETKNGHGYAFFHKAIASVKTSRSNAGAEVAAVGVR